MGLGELVEEIAAAGDTEVQDIRRKAQAEADAILAQARVESDAASARWAAHGAEEADAASRRILASAELEAKKLRLAAEASVLQAVRDAVTGKVAKLSPAERAGLTQGLVKRAGLTAGKAWAREDDAALVKELGFEWAGAEKGLGGIVVEDPSGDTREDLRFETLVDEAWRAVVKDVASDLFGK